MASHKGNPNLANISKEPRAELRTGKRTAQCADCLAFFTGIAPFDTHLIRNIRNPNIPPRCMTPAEMEKAGLRTNSHGVWTAGGR